MSLFLDFKDKKSRILGKIFNTVTRLEFLCDDIGFHIDCFSKRSLNFLCLCYIFFQQFVAWKSWCFSFGCKWQLYEGVDLAYFLLKSIITFYELSRRDQTLHFVEWCLDLKPNQCFFSSCLLSYCFEIKCTFQGIHLTKLSIVLIDCNLQDVLMVLKYFSTIHSYSLFFL